MNFHQFTCKCSGSSVLLFLVKRTSYLTSSSFLLDSVFHVNRFRNMRLFHLLSKPSRKSRKSFILRGFLLGMIISNTKRSDFKHNFRDDNSFNIQSLQFIVKFYPLYPISMCDVIMSDMLTNTVCRCYCSALV